MTNDKLCDIIGIVGCVISAWCFGLCFFGASAWWGIALGLVLILISQFNYE